LGSTGRRSPRTLHTTRCAVRSGCVNRSRRWWPRRARPTAEDALFGAARGDELGGTGEPGNPPGADQEGAGGAGGPGRRTHPGFRPGQPHNGAWTRPSLTLKGPGTHTCSDRPAGEAPAWAPGCPGPDAAHVRHARLRPGAPHRRTWPSRAHPPTPRRTHRATAKKPSKPHRNITDPDSRLLPTRNKGWVVGYNAQLAVSEDQIIIAADAVQSSADNLSFIPMLRAVEQGR
jgi:hypothetical protein